MAANVQYGEYKGVGYSVWQESDGTYSCKIGVPVSKSGSDFNTSGSAKIWIADQIDKYQVADSVDGEESTAKPKVQAVLIDETDDYIMVYNSETKEIHYKIKSTGETTNTGLKYSYANIMKAEDMADKAVKKAVGEVVYSSDYFELVYYESTDTYGYKITKGSKKSTVVTGLFNDEKAFTEAVKAVNPDITKDLSTDLLKVHMDQEGGDYVITSRMTGEKIASSSSESMLKQAISTYENEVVKKSRTVVETIDKGTYYLSRTEDGKWAYTIKSTGAYKTGYGDKGAASSAGKTAVKKESKSVLAKKGIFDDGHDQTEKLLSVYEKRAAKVYQQAAEEMASKQAAFMEQYGRELANRRILLEAGEMTEKEFKAWLQEQNMTKDWYKDMVDTLSQDMVNVDKAAMAMLNNELPEMYALNMNYGTFQIEATTGISTGFNMYDRSTVMKLLKDGNAPLLPQAGIDASKDLAWNKRKLNSAVTQGILQGESIPDIAKRLTSVVGMDYNGAIRSARTMTTAAQNAGRLESYRRAASMGIGTKKRWLATMDKRTRSSHVAIDLETVDLDKRFSNRCMYPGDPTGPGFEVYNCRCTMIPVVDGHEYDMSGRPNKLGKSWQQWQDENKALQQSKAARAASRQAAAAASMPSNSVPWQEYENNQREMYDRHEDEIDNMGRNQIDSLDKSERESVRFYSDENGMNCYTGMNGYKRGVYDSSDVGSRVMVNISNLDRAFKEESSLTTMDTYLYRGSGRSAMREILSRPGNEMAKSDPSILVGQTWYDDGYLSSTIKPGGVGFGGRVISHIYAPAGTRAMYIRSGAELKSEKEMLFQSGQKFKITHAEYDESRDTWELWKQAIID